jgi:hypothetical protein
LVFNEGFVLAAYTVAAGDVGKYELVGVANTEDTVTFTGTNLDKVDVVVHSGTSPVYFRFGSTAAVVKADGCYMATPGTAVTKETTDNSVTVVRVISAAACVYSVANAK